MSDTDPSMDYGREARQQEASDNPEIGMHYEKVDVANHIQPTDTRTVKIPGTVSEIYPEQAPVDKEIKVADLPDAVAAEYLTMFNEGKHDEAIALIRQDLIDCEAPQTTLALCDYFADEYRANQDRPEWKKWAADMTIWLRRAIVAKTGGTR